MADCLINSLYKVCRTNDAPGLDQLLNMDDSLKNFEQNGETPLTICASHGSVQTMAALLNAGADFNRPGCQLKKQTPLHCAAASGKTGCIRLLLEVGADANRLDGQGQTPLFLAGKNVHLQAVSLFAEHRADVNVGDLFGNTLAHLAVGAASTEGLEMLLRAGADLTRGNHKGETPAHIAARDRKTECLKFLVEHGAVEANRGDCSGRTPAHWASLDHRGGCLEVLLEGCAVDVNKEDKYGYTLAHWAAGDGSVQGIRHLAAHGADFGKKNRQGLTPLQYAAAAGLRERRILPTESYLQDIMALEVPRRVVMMIARRMNKQSSSPEEFEAQLGSFSPLNYDVMELIAQSIPSAMTVAAATAEDHDDDMRSPYY